MYTYTNTQHKFRQPHKQVNHQSRRGIVKEKKSFPGREKVLREHTKGSGKENLLYT